MQNVIWVGDLVVVGNVIWSGGDVMWHVILVGEGGMWNVIEVCGWG